MLNVRATKYRGRSLDCSYSLPRYWPRIPILNNSALPMMLVTTISEVQPGSVSPIIRAEIARTASSAAKSPTRVPRYKLMRNGRVEKELAAVHANESIFLNGYFDVP